MIFKRKGMNKTQPLAKFSFFKVEQYLNGELNKAELRDFEIFLKSNLELDSYVKAQRAIRYEGSMPVFHTKPHRVFESAFAQPSLSAWWRKVNDAFAPAFPPQLGWAMGLCLLAGAALMLFKPERMANVNSEYTAKGLSVPFQLHVGGRDIQSGQTGFAKAGDTLAFAYRNLAGMHVQVWYQDDGGEIRPYVATSNGSSSWPRASAWREADDKVVLFSDWNKESIWVLWSEENFTLQDARKVLEGGPGGDSMHKTNFQLVRTQ